KAFFILLLSSNSEIVCTAITANSLKVRTIAPSYMNPGRCDNLQDLLFYLCSSQTRENARPHDVLTTLVRRQLHSYSSNDIPLFQRSQEKTRDHPSCPYCTCQILPGG